MSVNEPYSPEVGKQAGENAREETLKIAREKGPRIEQALLRLRQGLNATTIKPFLFEGDVIYSKPLVDNSLRLRAVDMTLKIWDAYPAERHEIEAKGMVFLSPLKVRKPKNSGISEHARSSRKE